MDSYKSLDKPNGIFGIAFEDWGVFLSVSMLLFFVLNLLRNWVALPKIIYPVALLVVIGLFIVMKRSNKQNTPMYLHSRVAWWLTPRHLFICKPNLFINDQPNLKARKEKIRA